MYPVDLLKVWKDHFSPQAAQLMNLQTRMQIINPSPSAIYTGIANAFTTIARVEGTGSLWRGMTSVVMGAGRCSDTRYDFTGLTIR